MTEQTPEYLSDIEILDILQSMKKDKLDAEANEIIRNGGRLGVKKRTSKLWLH
jgi:hypothetical protein